MQVLMSDEKADRSGYDGVNDDYSRAEKSAWSERAH